MVLNKLYKTSWGHSKNEKGGSEMHDSNETLTVPAAFRAHAMLRLATMRNAVTDDEGKMPVIFIHGRTKFREVLNRAALTDGYANLVVYSDDIEAGATLAALVPHSALVRDPDTDPLSLHDEAMMELEIGSILALASRVNDGLLIREAGPRAAQQATQSQRVFELVKQ